MTIAWPKNSSWLLAAVNAGVLTLFKVQSLKKISQFLHEVNRILKYFAQKSEWALFLQGFRKRRIVPLWKALIYSFLKSFCQKCTSFKITVEQFNIRTVYRTDFGWCLISSKLLAIEKKFNTSLERSYIELSESRKKSGMASLWGWLHPLN